MTRKSSYEVFSLTFWRMKTSYDDLRAFLCYKISGNYVTFRALRVFSASSRHPLERRTCVESVRVRPDIVGDRLKPRNSVSPVLRKTKKCFKNSVLIETCQVFNTCTIESTYVCCYDFSWRKRISYERFLLEHEDTCFLSLTPDP